ncbi:unnamed protein product [Amoebophrya sp. A120]|nr:unnamed protein product [Amoebophrya sp. A120]|eukprot:GSA120T00015568001.1
MLYMRSKQSSSRHDVSENFNFKKKPTHHTTRPSELNRGNSIGWLRQYVKINRHWCSCLLSFLEVMIMLAAVEMNLCKSRWCEDQLFAIFGEQLSVTSQQPLEG